MYKVLGGLGGKGFELQLSKLTKISTCQIIVFFIHLLTHFSLPLGLTDVCIDKLMLATFGLANDGDQ